MEITTLVGAAAAIASTVSFAPQALKVIRTRDVSAISAVTYSISVTAFALWLSYGVLRRDWPLIATNTVTLTLASFILIMKLLPRDKREQIAEKLDPGA